MSVGVASALSDGEEYASMRLSRQATIGEVVDVDGSSRRERLQDLLGDIYDRLGGRRSSTSSNRHYSLETESWTEEISSTASLSEYCSRPSRYNREALNAIDVDELCRVVCRLRTDVHDASLNLVKQLKRRDHQLSRAQAKCNFITAILQAHSQKRSVDAKLQFSLEPPTTETGYQQWQNAMKAVARLPDGIPNHFRKKLWVTLACHHVEESGVDWSDVCRAAFNDRINPDDDALGLQIIKDLHRTGWSGLHGERERVLLKRVLLAYARYNKAIGYCQGFNVIAALVLEVVDYKEDVAFKVMVFLIEHVLPSGYFDQTLRALSVDMAVLRDLLHQRLPKMAAHLDALQAKSESEYEPPLTNVFSMQWFLTLFATCLPKTAVFRVWDSLMLEGSEVLLRTSLAIWAKISRRVLKTKTADEFYGLMGSLCQSLLQMSPLESNDLMQIIYTMAEFPYPGVAELRERYTWNIQPFSSTFKLLRHQVKSILASDGEDNSVSDTERDSDRFCGTSRSKQSAPDLGALKKQYKLTKQRQKQAAVILQNAYEKRLVHSQSAFGGGGASSAVDGPQQEAFNHLYVGQQRSPFATYSSFNGALRVASKPIQPSDRQRRSNNSMRTSSPVPSATAASTTTSRVFRGVVGRSVGSVDTTMPNETARSSGSATPVVSRSPDSFNATVFSTAFEDNFLRRSRGRFPSDIEDILLASLERRSKSVDNCTTSSYADSLNSDDDELALAMELGGSTRFGGRLRFRSLVDLNLVARRRNVIADEVSTPKTFTDDDHYYPSPPPDNLHRIRFDSLNTSGQSSVPFLSGQSAYPSTNGRSRELKSANRGHTSALYSAPNGHPTAVGEQRQLDVTDGGGKRRTVPKQQKLLNKSKALLNAIVAEAEKKTAAAPPPVFNPFPVKHRTSLIEREKLFGLYK